MNKTFCPSCGSKNIYQEKKPKFCANCGDALDVSAVSKAGNEDRESQSNFIEYIDLESLRRNIRVSNVPQATKFEDIAGTSTASATPAKPRPSHGNLPDGHEILKRNMADCAVSSQPKDIEGNG